MRAVSSASRRAPAQPPTRRLRWLSASVALLLLSACNASKDGGTDSLTVPDDTPSGRLRIDLTDAPFPMNDVVATSMTITRLAISHSGHAGSFPFEVRKSLDMTVDLLDLQNGVTETIFDEEIAVGEITQLRLFVEHASVTLIDGRTLDCLFPSGLEDGIEIEPEAAVVIEAGRTTTTVADFDLSLSFVPFPKGAQRASSVRFFMLRPEVRFLDVAGTGSLSGIVYDDGGSPGEPDDDVRLTRAVVSLMDGAEDVTRAVTDDDGVYRLVALQPGSYHLVAYARGFAPDTLAASVRSGADDGGNNMRLTPTE